MAPKPSYSKARWATRRVMRKVNKKIRANAVRFICIEVEKNWFYFCWVEWYARSLDKEEVNKISVSKINVYRMNVITITCGNLTFHCPLEDVHITIPLGSSLRVQVEECGKKAAVVVKEVVEIVEVVDKDIVEVVNEVKAEQPFDVVVVEENVVPVVEEAVIVAAPLNPPTLASTKRRTVAKKDRDPSNYLTEGEVLVHSFGLKGQDTKAICTSVFHQNFDLEHQKNVCTFTIQECGVVPSFVGKEFTSVSMLCKSFLKALVEAGLRDPKVSNSVNGWDVSKVNRNGVFVRLSKLRDMGDMGEETEDE